MTKQQALERLREIEEIHVVLYADLMTATSLADMNIAAGVALQKLGVIPGDPEAKLA